MAGQHKSDMRFSPLMSTLLSAPLAGCVRLASVHDSVAEQDVVSWAGKQRCCRNGVVCPSELVGCPWRW